MGWCWPAGEGLHILQGTAEGCLLLGVEGRGKALALLRLLRPPPTPPRPRPPGPPPPHTHPPTHTQPPPPPPLPAAAPAACRQPRWARWRPGPRTCRASSPAAAAAAPTTTTFATGRAGGHHNAAWLRYGMVRPSYRLVGAKYATSPTPASACGTSNNLTTCWTCRGSLEKYENRGFILRGGYEELNPLQARGGGLGLQHAWLGVCWV